MVLVRTGPCKKIIEDEHAKRNEQGVNKVHRHRDALMFGMRKGDVEVVYEEHAVERLDEEDDENIGRDEGGKAYIVRRVGRLDSSQNILLRLFFDQADP